MASSAVCRIDHINVISTDPAATLSVLAEALGLPVSAAMVDCPTFDLGILTAGNVTLESIRHRGGPPPGDGIALTGIVFEPASTAAAASTELRSRGVPHLAPLSFTGPHTRPTAYDSFRRSEADPNWQVFPVDGVLGGETPVVSRPSARAMVTGTPTARATAATMGRVASSRRLGRMAARLFVLPPEFLAICEWGHDVPARREADAQRFDAAQASGAGLTGVRAIVVTATDVRAARERWQRLLDPAPANADRWHLGAGPTLVLESGDRDGMARIVFGATSLATTGSWLDERGLLGALSTETELRVEPTRVGGLDLRIT